MKAVPYFWDRLNRPDRAGITKELCERVVGEARHVEEQPDGRFRFWGYVLERELYVRVVTLQDRETLLNTMWDENFTRKHESEREG